MKGRPAERDRRVPRLALACIAAITAWRLLCLALGRTDVFVDEAQYWLWGQELAFGYFSKPPLIGWLIRASTELGGDTAFWIRAPGPILYAAASVALLYAARRVWPAAAADRAGIAFATLPGVAVLALFISTDAALLPCAALAILAALALRDGPSRRWAVVLGLAIGLGLMAKYAMAYVVAGAALAALLAPAARIGWRDAGIAAAVAAAIVAPNVWWNLTNGLVTLSHTAENADWQGVAWNWSGLAEFVATQAVAIGPVFAIAYGLAIPRARPARGGRTALICVSLPILAAVAAQALIREANGNWAAPAFLGATALAAPWLWLHARAWFRAGLAFNVALAVFVSVLTVFPDLISVGGRPLLDRAQGVAPVTEAILAEAEARGVATVVARDRRLLADLALRAKGTGIAVRAWPPAPGRPPANHYELTRPAGPGDVPALVVVAGAGEADCIGPQGAAQAWRPASGGLRGMSIGVYLWTAPCWAVPDPN